MNPTLERSAIHIISGKRRGAWAWLVRGVLCVVEIPYAFAMRCRNWLFDAGIFKAYALGRRLPRPPVVISFGNITTGGTGKTPAIQWIAGLLLRLGHRPAVLMRGYRAPRGKSGDEATLLEAALGVPIGVGSDRVQQADRLLDEHPEIDVFLLDDGFQHRRVRRDLDIVLIDATNPFGYGHVLPRGLLREPLVGLRRADVFIITRSDQVSEMTLSQLSDVLRRYNSDAMLAKARHYMVDLVCGESRRPMESIAGHRVYTFCGIGNPQSFHQKIIACGATDAGSMFFNDHHDYTADDLGSLAEQAESRGAEMLITTAKDWVKICALPPAALPRNLWVAEMRFELQGEDEHQLQTKIKSHMLMRR